MQVLDLHFLKTLRLAAIAVCASSTLFGSLIVTNSTAEQGGGLGDPTTFLVYQAVNNPIQNPTGAASACVAAGAGGTAVTGTCAIEGGTFNGGDEQTSHNTVFAFGGDASALQLIFNASEPQSPSKASNPITLNNVQLTLYSATGSALWSSSGLACAPGVCTVNANGSVTLTTQPGVGNFGWTFMVNQADGQAAALEAAALGQAAAYLGLAVSSVGGNGGLEVWRLNEAGGGGIPPDVPEPSTYLLMGSGLALVGLVARRRRV